MNKHIQQILLFAVVIFINSVVIAAEGIVVVQTDFGLQNGAVSEVKGVMYSVDKSLLITDLSHNIPAYNIWEAAYHLVQTAPYWPQGTVFVSVVDPGVGTSRRSIVAETKNGQYFVTPDNGTLTLIADKLGIKQVRTIDENTNRLAGSRDSYTFFGRDVYGYTAARLASGKISFAEVGPVLNKPLVRLPYQKAEIKNNIIYGTLTILDDPYGNIWTNIDKSLFAKSGYKTGDKFKVSIYENHVLKFTDVIAFHNTFGEVKKGENLLYLNSLLNVSIAANQGDFATLHHLSAGPQWSITLSKVQ